MKEKNEVVWHLMRTAEMLGSAKGKSEGELFQMEGV